jgi:hypothetical protein
MLVKSDSESGEIFKLKLPQGFAAPNVVLGRAWRGPWRGSQKIPFTGGSLYRAGAGAEGNYRHRSGVDPPCHSVAL